WTWGDPLVADLDVGDAQVTRLTCVGIPDRAIALPDRLDHAGGAVAALTTLERPRLAGLVGPHRARNLMEIVREGERRTRVVGAVNRGDLGVREFGARVVRRDLGGVPL